MDGEHPRSLDCGPCREKKKAGEVAVPEEKKASQPQGVTLTQEEYEALMAKASFGDTAAEVASKSAIEDKQIEKALDKAAFPYLTVKPLRIHIELSRQFGVKEVIKEAKKQGMAPAGQAFEGYYTSDMAERLFQQMGGVLPEAGE
jgi:hypothetical protein